MGPGDHRSGRIAAGTGTRPCLIAGRAGGGGALSPAGPARFRGADGQGRPGRSTAAASPAAGGGAGTGAGLRGRSGRRPGGAGGAGGAAQISWSRPADRHRRLRGALSLLLPPRVSLRRSPCRSRRMAAGAGVSGRRPQPPRGDSERWRSVVPVQSAAGHAAGGTGPDSPSGTVAGSQPAADRAARTGGRGTVGRVDSNPVAAGAGGPRQPSAGNRRQPCARRWRGWRRPA